MQPCQRRTIGGSEGRGRWTGDPRHPSAPPPPPLSLLGSPSHPIPSVRRDCTARGRYWGAYGSAQGDAPVRLSTPSLLSLSIYLFQSTLARDYIHTDTRSLSLSLLRWSSVSVRRVGTSGASMIPSRSSQPMLALPCFVQHRSNRVLFGPPVPSPRFGRRGKRFMGGGWPEKLGETGKKELPILGNDVSPWDIFCAHPPPLGSRRASPRESGGFHTWMINLGHARNFGVNGIGF